jgi:hypothetical protein
MPVADHPTHPKTSFKEVPLSPCHSSLPDQTRDGYWVLNLYFRTDRTPCHSRVFIKNEFVYGCKQPTASLPECRGCTKPGERDAQRVA